MIGKFAKSFADAVLVKPMAAGKMAFGRLAFNVFAPENSADVALSPAFALTPGATSKIAVLFTLDNFPSKIPAFTLAIGAVTDAGLQHFEERFDMRQKAYASLKEVGRILRGPSGTLSFPFYIAEVPLKPECAKALENAVAATIAFVERRSSVNIFGFAPVPWDGVTPISYCEPEVIAEPVPDPEVSARGFTLRVTADLAGVQGGETLYEVPGAFSLVVRDIDKDPADDLYDARGGNYLNFPMTDGRRLVIEARMPGPTGRIGLPLGLLDESKPVKDILVHNDNVKFSILVEGHLDQDFPIADIFWTKEPPKIDKGRVRHCEFLPCAEENAIPKLAEPRPIDGTIQFWSPEGHNQWLGDVVLANFDGAVHVFYLVDRRHHNSKGGRGGHWFEHLASKDLVHWGEYPAAVAMDKRTEYIGTGTPLKLDGKYFLAYGLHTTRHAPVEETSEPEQAAYFKAHGTEGLFKMADLKGLPMGGTYATSTDGIHFEKSGILFTSDQNPSLYARDDGLIGLGRVNSLWYSDHLGDWKLWDKDTPTWGDCPCPFSWNGWHYVIQGFCTMGASPSGKPGTYEDMVAKGLDIYEGLSVPMVVPYGENRRLYVGWINHVYGWGGWICFRELVQEPDGVLGSKWVPEIKPPVAPAVFEVAAGEGLKVRFDAASPDASTFEFSVDAAESRAQFAFVPQDGAVPRIPSLREISEKADPPRERIKLGRKYRPDDGNDFAIEHVRGLGEPYQVRLVHYYDAKSGVTIVDAEIAGRRTMVTRRLGKFTMAAAMP